MMLEVVAVGEVAEGVVVRHQQAALGGDRGERRRPAPRRVPPDRPGRPSRSRRSPPGRRPPRRAASPSAGQGGGDPRRVEPDVRVGPVVELERVDVVADAEHGHAAVLDGVERVDRGTPRGRARWRRRASPRRAPRGRAATARRRAGRRRAGRWCGRRGCRRRRRARRCRPRSRSWPRRSGRVSRARRRRRRRTPRGSSTAMAAVTNAATRRPPAEVRIIPETATVALRP